MKLSKWTVIDALFKVPLAFVASRFQVTEVLLIDDDPKGVIETFISLIVMRSLKCHFTISACKNLFAFLAPSYTCTSYRGYLDTLSAGTKLTLKDELKTKKH